MPIFSEDVTRILEQRDALWIHSGNPKDPHAELTSGKCSDGFVDVLRALRYTDDCMLLAEGLVTLLRKNYSGPVDWVVGSDHAGAALSHSVAILFHAKHDFTEKKEELGDGEMVKEQLWRRFEIKPGDMVLQVEDLITTTGTLLRVRQGIRAGNHSSVRFVPFSLVLVHRSDVYEIEGEPILYLAHYDIRTWEPADCPLCRAGSKRLRPKKSWAELVGR